MIGTLEYHNGRWLTVILWPEGSKSRFDSALAERVLDAKLLQNAAHAHLQRPWKPRAPELPKETP